MAHPLNRPRFAAGERARVVVDGYGILQPRVGVSLPRRQPLALRPPVRRRAPASIRTRARCPTSTRTCSAKARSSARASTTSMRSSARSAAGFPRTASSATTCSKAATRAAGLLSDVAAVRGLSGALRADVQRRHRWIRGDWQIAAAGCCRARASRARARPARAAQSAVGAVALEDPRQPAPQPGAGGARRAAAARLARCCARPWLWTLARAGGPRVVPALLAHRCATCCASPTTCAARTHLRGVGAAARRQLRADRWSTLAACRTRRAYSLDAIVRTLWRMLVSRRRPAGVAALADAPSGAAGAAIGELADDVPRAWRSRRLLALAVARRSR